MSMSCLRSFHSVPCLTMRKLSKGRVVRPLSLSLSDRGITIEVGKETVSPAYLSWISFQSTVKVSHKKMFLDFQLRLPNVISLDQVKFIEVTRDGSDLNRYIPQIVTDYQVYIQGPFEFIVDTEQVPQTVFCLIHGF